MPLVDRATIEEAARRLHEAAPGSTVILFGSYARGDAREDSDVDFLVVKPEVRAWHHETVELLAALEPLGLDVDVLLASRGNYDRFSQLPGNVLAHAAREGRELHAPT